MGGGTGATEQRCMNCGAERNNDAKRNWEGVPVCIECYTIATTIAARMRRQVEHLATIQHDKIRQCLVEGKLVLNVLREDAKLVTSGVHAPVYERFMQEGPDPGGGAQLASGNDSPLSSKP